MDYVIMNSDNIKGSDEHGAYFEFMITNISNLDKVPTNAAVLGCVPRPGSVIVCLSPISLYALSPERTWELIYEKEVGA